MTTVQLGVGAYQRDYAQEPEIILRNRFLEKNPTNLVEQIALLARPGDTKFTGAGEGPISWIDHQPGTFDNDLFFVSGEQLYRYDGTTNTAITGTIATGTTPSVTFVSGAGYEHLFITDGVLLQYYDGDDTAFGTLTSTSAIADADIIQIDSTFYSWVSGSVDAGTPDGTSNTTPWLVDLGASDEEAFANMILALNAGEGAGTTYSTALTAHGTVAGVTSSVSFMEVEARTAGVGGDSIDTLVDTGAFLSWGAITLEGGGVPRLKGIVTPDDITFVSLTTLASFALCAQSLSQRFYWIQPGAVTIDALDFAEAESEPDEIIELKTIGDVVYMFGQSSTEVWYKNSSTDVTASAFLPTKGLAFSQGVLEGTAVAIRTQAITIAEDGVVYSIVGGPKRISNNGIEERIRLFRKALGV